MGELVESKMVHFSIGADAGILIMNIAQEHLIYGHNPQKAVTAITDSLMGVPLPLALKILKGDIVLNVDVEKQEVLAGPYDESIHKGIFPRLDCAKYAERHAKDIFDSGKNLRDTIQYTGTKMKYAGGTLRLSISYDRILQFVGGDEKRILEDIMDSEEVSELAMLVRVIKSYIEKSVAELAVIHFMKKTWPEEFDPLAYNHEDDARDMLRRVMESFSDLMKLDYSKFAEQGKAVDSFIEAAMEINKIIEKGIEPVDIMQNYSAGWLAPDGTYYALNGDIANLLHNQIADALYEKGIIPATEENEANPDNWLLGEGWVRVHGNLIMFEGNLNERARRGVNKFMTNKQVDTLTNYCRVHHMGIIKCTFQALSALSFQAMAKSPSRRKEFYRDYFMGDLGEV